jgi:hypothetical protein
MFQMFDNIASLTLGRDGEHRLVASAMVSCEGEVMAFRESVPAVGRVEDWMNDVLNGMRDANRYATKKAIFDYAKLRRTR